MSCKRNDTVKKISTPELLICLLVCVGSCANGGLSRDRDPSNQVFYLCRRSIFNYSDWHAKHKHCDTHIHTPAILPPRRFPVICDSASSSSLKGACLTGTLPHVFEGTSGGFCRSSEETNKNQRGLSSLQNARLEPCANASTPEGEVGGVLGIKALSRKFLPVYSHVPHKFTVNSVTYMNMM